jgi:hypothetical protein
MTSTDSILKGKYPAKSHARRVANYLQAAGYPKEGIIYLESQKTRLIEDNDEPVAFRYVHHNASSLLVPHRVEREFNTLLLPLTHKSFTALLPTLHAGNDVHSTTSLAANCPTHT